MVDGRVIEIHNDILAKIRQWNSENFRNDVNLDRKITQALLVLCVGATAVANGQISDKVVKFIKGEISTHYTDVYNCQ